MGSLGVVAHPNKSYLRVRLVLYDDLQKRLTLTAKTENAAGEVIICGYF